MYVVFFQNIATSYNKQGNMTADEAKVGFLKAVSRWPTFGCAFFEVKVSAVSKRPAEIALSFHL